MNYRLATLLEKEAHTSDITKVIDLTLVDKVSQLSVIYEPMNGAVGAPTAHPAKCVSKIELVDGSDVIFSLSGLEAQAVDWYHRKQEPSNVILYLDGNASEMVYNINFGRFLYDPLFAFDPQKFRNPQIKITLDIDAGGISVASGYLTVLAYIFDEKVITPSGFLMHKEIKDYALAASAHEYTDLPVDNVYRKIFARIQKYGTGPDYCFDTVKLSEDNDKRIPFNHSISQILKAITGQMQPYKEMIVGNGSSASQYFYCTPGYWPVFAASQWRAAIGGGELAFYEGDGGRFKQIQTGAGPNWQAICQGWCPHSTICLEFGDQSNPEDWYDVSKVKNLKLDIKSASGMSSSESCQIFMQQLRKYAA